MLRGGGVMGVWPLGALPAELDGARRSRGRGGSKIPCPWQDPDRHGPATPNAGRVKPPSQPAPGVGEWDRGTPPRLQQHR